MPPSDRTAKIIESDESLTLSITNPLGTSDEIRIPARMALIPRWRTASSAEKSSDVSQTPKSKPMPGPHLVYAFLMTEPNTIVEPIHPKAMTVILTSDEERDV
jgi:hypothetical protein